MPCAEDTCGFFAASSKPFGHIPPKRGSTLFASIAARRHTARLPSAVLHQPTAPRRHTPVRLTPFTTRIKALSRASAAKGSQPLHASCGWLNIKRGKKRTIVYARDLAFFSPIPLVTSYLPKCQQVAINYVQNLAFLSDSPLRRHHLGSKLPIPIACSAPFTGVTHLLLFSVKSST